MPEILVKFEEKIIEKFITEKKRITIGRTPDNDIVLDNRGVSRR
ncbi:MAG TPA: FHA domain-containing protein, partial [candidate division Zixibacteria bacterium]|nr:FHA domain-containing protein [candidate division Zixibacteria bacterium]